MVKKTDKNKQQAKSAAQAKHPKSAEQEAKVAEILEDLAMDNNTETPVTEVETASEVAAQSDEELVKEADKVASAAEDGAQVEISKDELEQFIGSVSQLVKEKEAAETAQKESEDKFVRLQADFDNFRKRTRQEKEDVQLRANQELLKGLLPILDNFRRALETEVEQGGFREGIELIYRQLQMFMEQAGVAAIEAVGQPFDPNFHEAVLQQEVAEAQKGLVLTELQTGYTLHGKLLRPSMVQVGV